MIEESEDSAEDIKAATVYYEELKSGIFKNTPIGLIHGKMKAKEKEKVMTAFARGDIKLLVSTTVIEVGVDVPNAVIMVIENAERFGLSQLHQLRGRVGRGDVPSTCIFISNSDSKTSKDRLKVITSTTDGFKLAEADLKARGPGNFLGKEQHGLPNLKFADTINNTEIINISTAAADMVLKDDICLEKDKNHLLKDLVLNMFNPDKRIEFN
jgi:ATP-dependent DNA helicase RecG